MPPHPSPGVDELRAEMRVLVEVHEYLQRPYSDVNDLKGYLTHRKKKVRRKIEAAKREQILQAGARGRSERLLMRSEVYSTATSDGGHDIRTSGFNGADGSHLLLVRVRPVGTLEWGELDGPFSHRWVGDLIHALEMAARIVNEMDHRCNS